MTCSQCDCQLQVDAPAVLYDRVEYRFCSVHCMTGWVIDLDSSGPLPAGTTRVYWHVLDVTS